MGIKDWFGSIKNKTQEFAIDKALEKMRDLKQPTKEKEINKLLETHVAVLPGVKSADVDINSDCITFKVKFTDDRATLVRKLTFKKLIWDSQKRAFVFGFTEEKFDVLQDHITYACVCTMLVAVLKQLLGINEKTLEHFKTDFTTEIGPITGNVMEKDGEIFYELKRIPVLRQYAYIKVMGQSPLDHMNVTDCWVERGQMVVRIDNQKIVDQIKSMNLSPEQLKQMMQGKFDNTEE